jgi:predicted TIM-barrel fold metal-dependent hydrolase
MARSRENVYLDLSHTLHYYQGSSVEADLRFLVRRLDRRLLFGSDFPECPVGTALRLLDSMLVVLSEDRRSAVRGHTWARILNRSGSFPLP